MMYLGDVAPFVRPANLLAAEGHDVTFVVPAGYHELLGGEAFTLARYPLDCSAPAMFVDPEHRRLMRHPVANVTQLMRYWLRKAFVDDPEAVRRGLLASLDGSDVVVSHPTASAVVAPVARHLGIPLVVGHLFPMMIPTAAWTFPMDRWSPSFGASVNQGLWRIFTKATGALAYDRAFNAHRRRLGCEPMVGNTLDAWRDAAATVMLVSPSWFGRQAPDWPAIEWGGFSPWAGPSASSLDPSVDAYLDVGDPPVLVTLGTSAATGAAETFDAIAAQLDGLGLRSLLLVGDRSHLRRVARHPGAFAFAPLHEVLPRCRMTICSGALGTLSASLTHGKPVVVHPQLFDQVWHGGRAEALGVGALARRSSRIGAVVERIVGDDAYDRRAGAFADRLQREDGGRALADAVARVLTQDPAPRPSTGAV